LSTVNQKLSDIHYIRGIHWNNIWIRPIYTAYAQPGLLLTGRRPFIYGPGREPVKSQFYYHWKVKITVIIIEVNIFYGKCWLKLIVKIEIAQSDTVQTLLLALVINVLMILILIV